MVPHLDLSQSTHGKVMVAPPRINLRRAASYNASERAASALSSSSSRFSFNHLLFASPPPSPSLPALVPRRKRSTSDILFKTRPSRIVKNLFYVVSAIATLYFITFTVRHRDTIPLVLPHAAKENFELVGQDSLPDFPTPIIVNYSKKKASQWTVAIPRNYDFPLSISEYSGMNGRCREVSSHARDLHHQTSLSDQAWLADDVPDNYFIDVQEAEQNGLLATPSKGQPPTHSGHFVGLSFESMSGKQFCSQSLTYVLESPDAGLGATIMTMWTLYALAKEQGRAFFIDDTRWAYGRYTDMFQPPPIPDCRPPPRHQMLPCPAQARHLVVSGVTVEDTLPALLAKHHRDTGSDLGSRDLLELARVGYKDLFKLLKDDEEYVTRRVGDLKTRAKSTDPSMAKPVIGLHVRHGDQHPFEYQYRDTYIPAEVFAIHANQQAKSYYKHAGIKSEKHESIKVIASDDPMVHEEAEFNDAFLAQERIRLATKENVEDANKDPHYLHSFVEEAFGWEGGFFAPVFWNLGGSRKSNAVGDGDDAPSEQTLKLRSLVGRAYMMDMAVLSGASDKVVCAVSAMGCRLLGVMMGWERGIQGANWVNVDGGYGWGGLNL